MAAGSGREDLETSLPSWRPVFESQQAGAPERQSLRAGGTSATHPSAGDRVVQGGSLGELGLHREEGRGYSDPSQADSRKGQGGEGVGEGPGLEALPTENGRSAGRQVTPGTNSALCTRTRRSLACYCHSTYGADGLRGNEDLEKLRPALVTSLKIAGFAQALTCVNNRRQ